MVLHITHILFILKYNYNNIFQYNSKYLYIGNSHIILYSVFIFYLLKHMQVNVSAGNYKRSQTDNMPCIVYNMPCIVYNVPCIVYNMPCIVYNMPFIVYNMPFIVYPSLFTLHCLPFTDQFIWSSPGINTWSNPL